MKDVLILVVLLALAAAVYFAATSESRRKAAIVDCAETGDVATCLKWRYGWSAADALDGSLQWRFRGQE